MYSHGPITIREVQNGFIVTPANTFRPDDVFIVHDKETLVFPDIPSLLRFVESQFTPFTGQLA